MRRLDWFLAAVIGAFLAAAIAAQVASATGDGLVKQPAPRVTIEFRPLAWNARLGSAVED